MISKLMSLPLRVILDLFLKRSTWTLDDIGLQHVLIYRSVKRNGATYSLHGTRFVDYVLYFW